MLHAFQQGADATAVLVRNRLKPLHPEHELLVLGADAELRPRLAARLEPRDEIVARFDRSHVDLVASHADFPAGKGRDLTRRL